jgi:sugar lactone lactonase YvrE
MKNLLVRAAQITAIALPLMLPTFAAANPVGPIGVTVGSQATSQITRSSLNARQRLMQVSGHSAAATPGTKSSWIDPRYAASIVTGTTPLVYASITGGNEILAYASNAAPPPAPQPGPVETITGLAEPAGLAVDAMGNLYVVELVNNDVKVFKPGQLMPFETLLPAPGSAAFLSVAVDARGTVYVATSNGSIAVYAKGATTPSNTLSDPAIKSANGIAVDGVGNIFLNYVGLVSSNVQGYAVGAVPVTTSIGETFFHRLNIDSAPNSPQPLGLTLDKNGDLVIADTMGIVSIYRPATNTPVMSFQATGLIGNVFNINLALTGPNNRHLFMAPHDTNTIYEYAYPSGTLEPGITLPFNTVVEGLATSPAPARGVW